jgi:Uma2 family endonuclease
MSIAFLPEAPSEIVYPETDGLPMAENTIQFRWIVVIKEGLEVLFQDNPDVFIAGDLFWYPVEGDPTTRVAPDTMVVLGRPKGDRRSYRQWEEGDVAPQVVFEILSPGNRDAELARKQQFYERYGVKEYFTYDPDDGALEGWIRAGERLEPVPQMDGFVSPLLGIKFEPGDGPDNLTIRYPDGNPFVTFGALHKQATIHKRDAEAERKLAAEERERAAYQQARAEQERARAEQEQARAEQERILALAEKRLADEARQRADDEKQRADQEKRRADELEARLRELEAKIGGTTRS